MKLCSRTCSPKCEDCSHFNPPLCEHPDHVRPAFPHDYCPDFSCHRLEKAEAGGEA